MPRDPNAPAAWTVEQMEQVKLAWAEGHTASQIAVFISKGGPLRTKNAVLGLVHRLGLVKRPSPIPTTPTSKKPGRPKKPAPAPPPQRVTPPAPARPKAQRQAGMYDGRSVAERRADTVFGHARRVAAPPVLTMPLASVPVARHRTCQWPIGDVGAEDFRFCSEPAVTGKPYCGEHCAKAYVPREKRP